MFSTSTSEQEEKETTSIPYGLLCRSYLHCHIRSFARKQGRKYIYYRDNRPLLAAYQSYTNSEGENEKVFQYLCVTLCGQVRNAVHSVDVQPVPNYFSNFLPRNAENCESK